MNYVIAVLTDRIRAEEAYSALEKAGLPLTQVSILGRGFKSADEFGFIDPQKPARKQALMMSTWVVPLGFIGGLAFNLATDYQLVPAIGTIGNQLLGGVFGALAGALGSFVVGGGVGLTAGSGDALPYRNRLNEGKYLIVVEGAPNITNQASRILRECSPESLQAYVDPTQI